MRIILLGVAVALVVGSCTPKPSTEKPSTMASTVPVGEVLTPWRVDGKLPYALAKNGIAAVGNGLFIFGGSTRGSEPNNRSFMYYPGGMWAMKASMPSGGRHDVAVAVSGGRVYSMGGYLEGAGRWGRTNDVWAYNPLTNTWSTATSLSYERASAGGAAIGDYIYIVGGHHEDTGHGFSLTRVERLNLVSGGPWQAMASLQVPRRNLGVALVDGKIYVFGGTWYDIRNHPEEILNSMEIYDPTSNTWSYGPSMPTGRDVVSTVVLGNRIYAIGGRLQGGAMTNVVEYYDTVVKAWRTDQPLPIPLCLAGAAVVGNTIYVAGGLTGQDYNNYSDRVYRADLIAKH